MISCVLNGGLGNQLFQIATTYALALENNDECAFNFDVPCVNQGNSPRAYKNTIFKNIEELPKGWKPDVIYQERCYGYSKIPYSKDMLLKGYFQREEYFWQYQHLIRQLFRDENLFICCNAAYNLFDSVSIHVRRGDYLLFKDAYYTQPIEYYNKALSLIKKDRGVETVYVISDDMAWCKQNFNDPLITFVENESDIEDFYLMCLCENHIMSNSSFSWWGSYLFEKINTRTIAPKNWFKNPDLNNGHITPLRWKQI